MELVLNERPRRRLSAYRGAVKWYENYLRSKYGRSDYWRVYLQREADVLLRLRAQCLQREKDLYNFYRTADTLRNTGDQEFAKALANWNNVKLEA